MVDAELEKRSKNWNTRNLREILDLWSVGSVEILNQEVDYRDDGDANSLITHRAEYPGASAILVYRTKRKYVNEKSDATIKNCKYLDKDQK
jgi:hypothetical protein